LRLIAALRKLLIVDDQRIFAPSLALLLAGLEEVAVAVVVTNGQEALRKLQTVGSMYYE
jgi:CheY-like chemotaxis protein